MTACTRTDCYLEIRFLPASCRPAWVARHDGATLVAIDPRTTRNELVGWAVTTLTVDEQNAYRAAYDQPGVGNPLDDDWMTDEPFPSDVPRSLVLEVEPSVWRSIPQSRAG